MYIRVIYFDNTERFFMNFKSINNKENVIILDLTDNNLTKLPEKCFDNLINLQGLYIRDNKLTELPDKCFDNLTNLQKLFLNNEGIRYQHVLLF